MLSTGGEHDRSSHVIDDEVGEVHDDLRYGGEAFEDVDNSDSGADEAGLVASSPAR